MLRYLTAGESHGKGLVAIIDNFPAGVAIDESFINEKLRLRQSGYGRGARQKIETDRIEFLSGVRGGFTTGSPISFFIKNKDYENWKERMDAFKPAGGDAKISIARPGHADFSGYIKFGLDDVRNVLERSSARETASRVAAGAIFQLFLNNFGIKLSSAVLSIGGKGCKNYGMEYETPEDGGPIAAEIDLFDEKISASVASSDLRMPCPDAEESVTGLIDEMKTAGDTLGGMILAQAKGLPPGIGSFTQWDEKLDANIALSVMSVQAIKSVEIGAGIRTAFVKGSECHDSIYTGGNAETGGFFRRTDNAGGIEGGMSNGSIVSVRCAMKPIPTLMKPYLDTVNLKTGESAKAFLERSDVCAVPAASIVVEAALAFPLCLFFLKKFGSDSTAEIKRNYGSYLKNIAVNGAGE